MTFKEIIDGYGFEEVEQTLDGIYCTGCFQTFKRPSKMYNNGQGVIMCRKCIEHFYNQEDTNA